MICRQILPDRDIFRSAACVFAFATLVGIASAAEISATGLDGSTTHGELREWNNKEVVIATPAGDRHIDTGQLISLRWQPTPASPATSDNNTGFVELTDGSILPIKSIQIEQSKATVTLASPTKAAENNLVLPSNQLAAVCFRGLGPPLAKQWDEIRHLNTANDVLAVLKKDGKSLDYVEGVIGDVSADKIDFKLEGEMQHVDRAKIAGAVYHRLDHSAQEKPRATLQGRSGVRLNAARVELKDSLLDVTTSAGTQLRWPLDDISLADFSAGKLLYLSDIEPASEDWTPLIGLPAAATIASTYGRPRRDRSAYGGPLALAMKQGETAAAQAATRSFNKGLALHSRTEVIYRLPPGFRRFIALAGIDPATSTVGNAQLIISADDHVLLNTNIAGDQPPHPIQLDIANVKRLKIVVDYGQNLDTGDWLNLCDARIVK
ncbi:MAG TPA: NPCBM/NEW2 domain-containing protein [Lacipirellulaceae bacterium]|nr:NPCBM/NEW2 domain-containing protein [Lacipirellulaceae bacterium]